MTKKIKELKDKDLKDLFAATDTIPNHTKKEAKASASSGSAKTKKRPLPQPPPPVLHPVKPEVVLPRRKNITKMAADITVATITEITTEVAVTVIRLIRITTNRNDVIVKCILMEVLMVFLVQRPPKWPRPRSSPMSLASPMTTVAGS